MSDIPAKNGAERPAPKSGTDLLLLSNGKVMAHNLTPGIAEILAQVLAPDDPLAQRLAQRPTRPECPNA